MGDIHNQLYLLFHSSLEEIHNVYTHQDLVRVYITHNEMVNTNIIVGPNYLGHITADVIMNRIEAIVCSNNFIPVNRGLQINPSFTNSSCTTKVTHNIIHKYM